MPRSEKLLIDLLRYFDGEETIRFDQWDESTVRHHFLLLEDEGCLKESPRKQGWMILETANLGPLRGVQFHRLTNAGHDLLALLEGRQADALGFYQASGSEGASPPEWSSWETAPEFAKRLRISPNTFKSAWGTLFRGDKTDDPRPKYRIRLDLLDEQTRRKVETPKTLSGR